MTEKPDVPLDEEATRAAQSVVVWVERRGSEHQVLWGRRPPADERTRQKVLANIIEIHALRFETVGEAEKARARVMEIFQGPDPPRADDIAEVARRLAR